MLSSSLLLRLGQFRCPATTRWQQGMEKSMSTSSSRAFSSPPPPPTRPSSKDHRSKFERQDRGQRRAPTIRWSNGTLLILSSAVGASVSRLVSSIRWILSAESLLHFPPYLFKTYVIGVNQGFNQGKKQGLLESQLGKESPPPSVTSLPTA